jgi:hypothetical protein
LGCVMFAVFQPIANKQLKKIFYKNSLLAQRLQLINSEGEKVNRLWKKV